MLIAFVWLCCLIDFPLPFPFPFPYLQGPLNAKRKSEKAQSHSSFPRRTLLMMLIIMIQIELLKMS